MPSVTQRSMRESLSFKLGSQVSGASVGFVTFNSSGSDADSNVVYQQQTSATTAAPQNRAVSSELSVAAILAMFLLQRFM